MPDILLPLFPLKVVLFPSTDLPLHIFEERYKEMIGECLQAKAEFGIVLVLDEGLASTGCTALITDVIRKFEDGRMDILVRGHRRFDIVRIDQEKSYLRGEAEFFEDEDGEPPPGEAMRQQSLELFQQVAEKLSAERAGEASPAPEVPEKDDPQLSFQIAARLPLDLAFRQTLLQLRSERERLDRVISYLKKLSVRITRVAEAHAKAGANGKAH